MDAVVDAFRWFTVDRFSSLVAVAALVGLLFAARSARSAREQAVAANEQAEAAKVQAAAAREQVDVSREQTAILLKQVQQSEALEMERRAAEVEALQPSVVVSVQQNRADPSVLVLVVENSGKTAARNVRVTPSTDLVRSDGKKMHEYRIFTDPVPVMPAGQRFQYFFEGPNLFSGSIPINFSVTVEADGLSGPLPPVTYNIDLDALRDVWIGETSFHKLVEEIKKTHQTLDKLRESVRMLDPEHKAWTRRGLEEFSPKTPDAGFP